MKLQKKLEKMMLPMANAPTDLDITRCFNTTFARSDHVVLVGGAEAPFYVPATAPHRSIIRYRENFAASALHEVAHWCRAGRARRLHYDFGYWYLPPPRDKDATDAFLDAEVPAQALESIFSAAAGLPFRVSLDDLELELSGFRDQFAARVAARVQQWWSNGLPGRAARFEAALRECASARWRIDWVSAAAVV
jgi:elongation factor P hydroxylase